MWKTDSTTWQILQLLFPKLLLFPPKKWMNLISDRLSTASIRYLNWPSPVLWLFQKECNKMVIEPHVVQFWSEIILVISNRTYAARSFDFKVTRMISAQIALHLVQLPLLILYNQLFIFLFRYPESSFVRSFSSHRLLYFLAVPAMHAFHERISLQWFQRIWSCPLSPMQKWKLSWYGI